VSSNSELLLTGYDAWNRGDLEAYLELLHPDVDMRFGMAMRAEDGLGIQFLNRRTFDEARTAVRTGRPEPDRTRTG
jgi:ketosteroid isomerase-like protein